MGVFGLGSKSHVYKDRSQPNPNPSKFRILWHQQLGRGLLVAIRYDGCTNFEGVKILLYQDVNAADIIYRKAIDPHFELGGPIARFEPTTRGQLLARAALELVAQ
jgi:hypothetical protein